MKPIGEILIEQGSISKDQLKKALEAQKKTGSEERLGEILIGMGIITEGDLVEALSAQFHYPYLPLKNISLSNETFRLVPNDLVLRYRFVPIEKIKEVMTIAIADFLDEKAIQEIEQTIKAKVHIFLTTTSQMETALRRYDNHASAGREVKDGNK